MQIIKSNSRPTRKASSEYFTGTVWQDPIIEAAEPARVRALKVAFEPGARTAWHTHPLGQTLYVICLLYTSPSPRDRTRSRMPSSA